MSHHRSLGGLRPRRRHAAAFALVVLAAWATCASAIGVAAADESGRETRERFEAWLDEFKKDAQAKGISPATLDTELGDVELLERVIELDRDQPEFTLTLEGYLDRVVSKKRLARARRALVEHRDVLDQVAERFGVQPRFIVALWGIESNFGRTKGSFEVIDALATLAFDGRRSAFFRSELLHALDILDQRHTDPPLLGSWAGATGQTQFMPSSFIAYAVDFDGDERRDIWNSTPDVLASIANYLARHGWRDDQTWGRPVELPSGFDPALLGRRVTKPLTEWQRLGVRRPGGADLPTRPLPASIIRPDPEGPAYVVYENFKTLMRWNGSEFFGVAVGTVADRIDPD